MKSYRGIFYSVQNLPSKSKNESKNTPEGLHLLLELGGGFKNKLLKLSSNSEKEIKNLIDKYLQHQK